MHFVILCLPAGSSQGELCRLFLMVHESCREHGATPSQYMAFLHVYTEIYSRKKSQLTTRQQHLQVRYVAANADAWKRTHMELGFVYFLQKRREN